VLVVWYYTIESSGYTADFALYAFVAGFTVQSGQRSVAMFVLVVSMFICVFAAGMCQRCYRHSHFVTIDQSRFPSVGEEK